jgi:hypothetical protein
MRKFEFTRLTAVRRVKLAKNTGALYDVDVIEHDGKPVLRQSLVEYMNKMGTQGWEIKAYDSSQTNFSIILQREVK